MASLTLAHNPPVVVGFDGFGAQYNQNVYAQRSTKAGVTPQNVKVMEGRVAELAPQLARVFFNAEAFDDDDLMRSFRSTMHLAQNTAGAINITLQGLGPKVLDGHPNLFRDFAAEIARLIGTEHISKVRWVTLRNEPNGTSPMKRDLYSQCYRDFHAELERIGLADRVGLMAGDLLQNSQGEWFKFLATDEDLKRVVKAYSIHVYWQFDDPDKIDTRLDDVSGIRHTFAPLRDRPLYVMECGARGNPSHNGVTEDPGFFTDGRRICETNVNAFQRLWFALQAARSGFSGVVAWDAYFGAYDRKGLKHYSLVGAPTEKQPWPRQPAFRALRLLARAVDAGWNVLPVAGGTTTQLVVAFSNPANPSQISIVGLDRTGATVERKTTKLSTYTIGEFPPNTEFQLCVWNKAGNGQTSFTDRARSTPAKTVSVAVPLNSAFVLTTRPIH